MNDFRRQENPPLDYLQDFGKSDAFWKTVLFLSPVGFIFSAFYHFQYHADYAALVTVIHTCLFLLTILVRKFTKKSFFGFILVSAFILAYLFASQVLLGVSTL